MLGDSGNGGHVTFAVDLPNDLETATLLSAFLNRLKARYDDGTVSIDEKVFNAARIWKVYGTWVQKGDEVQVVGTGWPDSGSP